MEIFSAPALTAMSAVLSEKAAGVRGRAPKNKLYSFLQPVGGIDDVVVAVSVRIDNAADAGVQDHSLAHHAGA